jgi:hypothetical protein
MIPDAWMPLSDSKAAEAARAERGEWENFFATAGPGLEAMAHERHKAEAASRPRLEREQRDYEASLDAELDAEAALLAEQDREAEEEAQETDPRKIFARKEKREQEHKEIERLVKAGELAKIPSFWAIRRQDLAIRRRQRAEAAHEAAEARAGIPRRQKSWQARRDAIVAEAEKALTGEDERHSHARGAIAEQKDRALQELGEYPVLPKPPIREPRVSMADQQELAKATAQLGAGVREMEKVSVLGAPQGTALRAP